MPERPTKQLQVTAKASHGKCVVIVETAEQLFEAVTQALKPSHATEVAVSRVMEIYPDQAS